MSGEPLRRTRRSPFLQPGAVLIVAASCVSTASREAPASDVVFHDDFEAGLTKWVDCSRGYASLLDAGDEYGLVLRLRADGDVHVLIRGSEHWGNVSIEGNVRFPLPGDSYLGVMYNHRELQGRSDFGLIYIKFGRRAYLQPNPHRDYNVTRTFYPEFEAPLSEAATIRAGEWQRFRVEIVGGRAHFYVGAVDTPQLTFLFPEPGSGRLGFQPRSVGNDVWIDDVIVRRINGFSYEGPAVPAAVSASTPVDDLQWEVAGPFPQTHDDLARDARVDGAGWRPFPRDGRGAIETARVIDYHGPNTVAYLRHCRGRFIFW